MEKLGQQEGAFACASDAGYQMGISKRFYAACAAMQGLLANNRKGVRMLTTEQLIGISYECADELLKQEHDNDIQS